MTPVYTIAGLGADQRMFDRLVLPDGFQHVPLPWSRPAADDSIEAYAAKLADSISMPNPILLGVSFGGLMALEVSRIVASPLTIIISSMKTRTEIPWYYRWAGRMRLHKLMGRGRGGLARRMVTFMNGAQSPESHALIADMMARSDSQFTRWAIDRLLHWAGCTSPGRVVHLHGTADRLLPYRYITADETLPGGHHFMTYDNAAWVNGTIAKYLLQVQGD